MKQVFLIHAHRDLGQLNTLIARLCDPDFVIYVHLDRKWQVDPSRVHAGARQVHPRVDVRWGAFSQVRAMLGSLRQVIASERDFDKLVFLSAQDYPVLPNAVLKRELAALAGRELIDTVAIGPGGWPAAYRYQFFHCRGSALPARLGCALASRVLRLTGRTRRLPGGLVPYGGSAWWSLSRSCLIHLLGQVDQQPRLARFFSTVLCPDEMFFQTLIMASPFACRVLPQSFRYLQWPEGKACNPKILVDADFEPIRASGAHFCRKLDSVASASLRARLELAAQEQDRR